MYSNQHVASGPTRSHFLKHLFLQDNLNTLLCIVLSLNSYKDRLSPPSVDYFERTQISLLRMWIGMLYVSAVSSSVSLLQIGLEVMFR